MEYLVTFFTHYGAMRFHKLCSKAGVQSKLMPVPRELSASCGVCVSLFATSAPAPEEHEDLELCYAINPGGVFTKVSAG